MASQLKSDYLRNEMSYVDKRKELFKLLRVPHILQKLANKRLTLRVTIKKIMNMYHHNTIILNIGVASIFAGALLPQKVITFLVIVLNIQITPPRLN